MQSSKKGKGARPPQGPSVFATLAPYRGLIALLAVLSISSNGLSLWLPKIISKAIDAYARHTLELHDVIVQFSWVSGGIFVLVYILSILQTGVSELVAKDMRNKLAAKISRQSYAYVQANDPAKLLTNLTSDMDSVKVFVAQAVVSIISSLVLIIGASALLININWKLALAVLAVVPLIGVAFSGALSFASKYFAESRVVIDRLNKVINESILGAGLIRVLDSIKLENGKFEDANAQAKGIGIKIISIFSALIPLISFIAGLATLVIVAYGGKLVIDSSLTLGDFAAFSSYLAILIFPIIMLGFVSSIIAQANASYARIAEVLAAPDPKEDGTRTDELTGQLTVKDVHVAYGQKEVLKGVSFSVKAKSRTAIIGPTAAGKTQLLYVLTGLLAPKQGEILVDGHTIDSYEKVALHRQMGFVFQDSIIFNMSLRENIAFTTEVSEESMLRAIETAELSDLVASLPNGLETIISERGTSLSGGQKQRLMLARALALNPKILLLDDFTARVDTATEAKILANVSTNYPDITLISVTQKIAPVEDYDQIILVMEGELLASGTHQHLLETSQEYVQIYNSQRSTNSYE